MADNYERLVRWYLRFNGYFTVENFYVHNPQKVYREHIGDDTETDILGIRMPYSEEVAGNVKIANHQQLVTGADSRYDIVIAEVKNVDGARPNSIWRHPDRDSSLETVKYIVRFIGIKEEQRISHIAQRLITEFHFIDDQFRIRYIMFSKSLSKGYAGRVHHISFDEIVRFLDEQRGQCWRDFGLGVASTHKEWEPLINEAFKAFNSERSPQERQSIVMRLLDDFGK